MDICAKVSTFVPGAKNLASKAFDSVKNSAAGKALTKFFVGTNETRYYDSTGNYYKKNGEVYDYYDAKGSKIAEGIDADTFGTKLQNGELITKEISEQSTISEIGEKITSFGTKLATGFKDALDKRIEFAKEVGTKALGLASDALTSIKENGFAGTIVKFFSNKTDKGYFDMKGNYYVRQSDGTYKYFNGNGDEIASGIPESEITQMLEDGLLTEGEVQTGDSPAKEAITKMKSSISNAWSNAKDTVSNAWDKFTSWLGGKGGEEITESILTGGGSGGKGGKTRVFGGKGGSGEELNGMPYYSQNDPKYRNKPYKEVGGRGSEDTIGERGCGPTAMAMVASKATGKNYDPTTMARMAEAGGYSTSVGTTPGYFGAAANALGISNRRDVPTADNLAGSLSSGNSVILQGVRSGKTNSPYTSEGHYVTATGLDGENVIINDPRGREYSGAYRMSDLLNDTVGMWSFGGKSGKFGKSRPNTYTKKNKLGGFGPGTGDIAKWLNIVREVKKAIAAQKPGYSQSNWIKITVGGKTLSVRTDCSGYVAACLKYFGVLNDSTNLTSSLITNRGNSAMLATGFTPGGWPGWDGLQEGDILALNGHTEIFAYNKDGKHYVYNCGSNNSTNSAVPTVTGHNGGYSTVWRCGPAGTGVVEGAASIDGTMATSYSSGGSTSSGGGVSSFGELLSGAATAFSNSIMKSLGFKVDDGSTSASTTGGSDYSSSSSIPNSSIESANLSGSNNAQKIWNYFKEKGLSNEGIAGLMGNMQQESGLNPTNLQNSYETKLGYSDQSYTNAVDNGSYNNFVHDSAGYGLVQWTYYSLKQDLLNYKKQTGKSIGDLGMQLDFLAHQLQNGYSGVWNTLKSTNNIQTASDEVMTKFERPADQSQSAKNKRASYGKSFYDLYAGKGGDDGGRPIRPSEQYLGGYGSPERQRVSVTSGSMQDSSSANVAKIIERNNATRSMTSEETSQLLNVMIGYLSQIVDNTGATSSELEALNSKDFGSMQTTNNTVNNTKNSYNGATTKGSQETADRSKYDMAKRVAAGILT